MNGNCHRYSTRSHHKGKLEDRENGNGIHFQNISGAMGQSPSGVGKLCVKTSHLEFASPSHRPVNFLTSQSENEVEWDLTSPSARRYQVLFSDKKSSTPHRTTPSRNCDQRTRRPALCKKNIAKGTADNSCSFNLFNELAALNDLVNSEQAQPTHPANMYSKEVKKNYPDHDVPVSKDLSTSDVFSDDSFSFTDSMLLSTQALENDALNCPLKNKDARLDVTPKNTPSTSPVLNHIRRSVELDTTTSPSGCSLGAISSPSASSSPCKRMSQDFSRSNSLSSKNNSTVSHFQPPTTGKMLVSRSKNPHQNNHPLLVNGRSRPQVSSLTTTAVKSNGRNDHFRKTPPSNASCKQQKREASAADQLFDDSLDDLLYAVADEVESQFDNGKKENFISASATITAPDDDDDDDLLQPEVLEFISQIESQAMASITEKKIKTTADIVEEKRQAAIRRREQRMLNRKP